MKLKTMIALVLAVGVAGCDRDDFRSRGTIASQGDGINTWHTKLQGCTRDPFDGLPNGRTVSILAFVWQDPSEHDPKMNNYFPDHPDFPLRLEFSRSPSGTVATLHTTRSAGIPLNSTVCSTLRLKTEEHPSTTPGGRPSLSGEVALVCGVRQGHITADLHFEGCRY